MEFSVIVLLYNAAEDGIKRTLDSILCQEKVSLEIILADDASANNCLAWAEGYLAAKGQACTVCTHKKNVGTVRNIGDALEYVRGKYVKCIGAGDMLFAGDILQKIKEFMDSDGSAMCFAKMQGYTVNDRGETEFLTCCYPGEIKPFLTDNQKRIQTNIILHHDWISGAAMFYRTEIFRKYLSRIKGTVRYCEDVLQAVLLLNQEKISYYPGAGVYYEMGTGLSTDCSSGSFKRMQTDHQNFWEMLRDQYPIPLVQQGYKMYQCEITKGTGKRILGIMFHNPGCLLHHWRKRRQRVLHLVEEQGILG